MSEHALDQDGSRDHAQNAPDTSIDDCGYLVEMPSAKRPFAASTLVAATHVERKRARLEPMRLNPTGAPQSDSSN